MNRCCKATVPRSARPVATALRAGLLAASLSMPAFLTGCTRSVDVAWEEEVVLASGEVIVVRREQRYARAAEPGNPLRAAWIAKTAGTMKFQWRGRDYTFSRHSVPMLLAISPEGQPVLIANPAVGGWDLDNAFPCATPYYVQFFPDATGAHWTWSVSIPPWTHGAPSNLLLEIPRPGNGRHRFSAAEVSATNRGLASPRHSLVIEPSFTPARCQAVKPRA